MTVKDLKAKLTSMDESCTLTLEKADGTMLDITRASQQGKHLAFGTGITS